MIRIMTEHLSWASSIGLFIINYGVLDWHLLNFLESKIPPTEFAKFKEKHFQDRVSRVKSFIEESSHYSEEQKAAFGKFFVRVDLIRTLRNHIAHGHLLIRLTEDGEHLMLTLSLPKDLDASYEPQTRHLEFQELANALNELAALIEEFKTLAGGWSAPEDINI